MPQMLSNPDLETQNRILRQQLSDSQRALQDLAYTVSHDLGTPLRAVTGFSSILLEKYAAQLDERGLIYLNFISDGGNKAQQMLSGLLNYSRIQTQAKPARNVELHDVVDLVRCELSDKIQSTGATIIYGHLPHVWADEEQMRQLFHAIIDNALTFHRANVAPIITISAEEMGMHWQISVEDNGLGIPLESCERVFQVFKRLHADPLYPGIGMGLPVARRIVERHGGAIGIKPTENHGTSVWFKLPTATCDIIDMVEDRNEVRHV